MSDAGDDDGIDRLDGAALDARIAQIEARTNAATPGPWVFEDHGGELLKLVSESIMVPNYDRHAAVLEYGDELGDAKVVANWTFVEHARQDIPWLIEQLKAARAAAAPGAGETRPAPTRAGSATADAGKDG